MTTKPTLLCKDSESHSPSLLLSSISTIAGKSKKDENEIENFQRSKKLIQIIDESINNNDDNDEDPDADEDNHVCDIDDVPPPLFTDYQSKNTNDFNHVIVKNYNASTKPNNENDNDNEPSLMEQMMKDAIKAKKENEIKLNEKARKETKKMSFGLKKGFLKSNNTNSNSSRKSTKAKKVQKQPFPDSNMGNNDKVPDIIHELDEAGNIIPIENKKEEIPTIKPKQLQNNSKHNNYTTPLRFQEVQDAMKNNTNIFNYLSNNEHEWNTPDLLDQISQNKIVSSGMTNPKFQAALEAFKNNPNQAMKQFQHHPDVIEFLREFCKIMGNHFTELGMKQEEEKKEKIKQNSIRYDKEDDLGPLAKDAIKKEIERKERGETGWNENLNEDEKKQLETIMQDKELTSLLMDMDMQRVMHECSTQPGQMRRYMHDKNYAPKLHKLIQAGLLKVVS